LHPLTAFVAHREAVEDRAIVYVQWTEVLFVSLVAAVFIFGGRRGMRDAIAALAAAGVALGIGQVLSHILIEQRPGAFLNHARELLPHAGDASFPSDHATVAFAIASAIRLRRRILGTAALVLAVALAVDLVSARAHYLDEVLAGAALGTTVAVALWWLPFRRVTAGIAGRLSPALRAPVVAGPSLPAADCASPDPPGSSAAPLPAAGWPSPEQ
jgi:undecaprenyl-diphosphatase